MLKKPATVQESTPKFHHDLKPTLGFRSDLNNIYPTFNASGFNLDKELERQNYVSMGKDRHLEAFYSKTAPDPYIAVFDTDVDEKRRIILFSHEGFFWNFMSTYGYPISFGAIPKYFSREA